MISEDRWFPVFNSDLILSRACIIEAWSLLNSKPISVTDFLEYSQDRYIATCLALDINLVLSLLSKDEISIP